MANKSNKKGTNPLQKQGTKPPAESSNSPVKKPAPPSTSASNPKLVRSSRWRRQLSERRTAVIVAAIIILLVLALLVILFIAATSNNQGETVDGDEVTAENVNGSIGEGASTEGEQPDGDGDGDGEDNDSQPAPETGDSASANNESSTDNSGNSGGNTGSVAGTNTESSELPASYSLKAKVRGDSISTLARRAMNKYLKASGKKLGRAQRLFAEVTLKNLTGSYHLQYGQTVTFTTKRLTKVYKQAKNLGTAAKRAWTAQADSVGYV